jgi:hypothetical protein
MSTPDFLAGAVEAEVTTDYTDGTDFDPSEESDRAIRQPSSSLKSVVSALVSKKTSDWVKDRGGFLRYYRK